MNERKLWKHAFRLTTPVMIGYLVMGTAFGIIIQTKGYSFVWAFAISLTVYSGSMQFVLAELLASASPLLHAALMTVAVQIRHVFYGLSLIDEYKKMSPLRRFCSIFGLTDETYSLQCSLKTPDGMDEGRLRFAVSVLDHSYWIAGCTAGALAGALIPFDFEGADFAMTALFVVIFVEQWQSFKGFKKRLPAMIGAVSAFVCLLIFGAERFIFPALAAATLALLALRPVLGGKEGADGTGN